MARGASQRRWAHGLCATSCIYGCANVFCVRRRARKFVSGAGGAGERYGRGWPLVGLNLDRTWYDLNQHAQLVPLIRAVSNRVLDVRGART